MKWQKNNTSLEKNTEYYFMWVTRMKKLNFYDNFFGADYLFNPSDVFEKNRKKKWPK